MGICGGGGPWRLRLGGCNLRGVSRSKKLTRTAYLTPVVYIGDGSVSGDTLTATWNVWCSMLGKRCKNSILAVNPGSGVVERRSLG